MDHIVFGSNFVVKCVLCSETIRLPYVGLNVVKMQVYNEPAAVGQSQVRHSLLHARR